MVMKLPLYRDGNGCNSEACDPDFIDDHTYLIIKGVKKGTEIVAECTGCGIHWEGNYKKHWLPNNVALALMETRPKIKLKKSDSGEGYNFK